ncbi:hypothetical protein E1B28_011149 [Marasmius oreades]|uniref:Uncharacterized protein n=1 Tax=Marasmius oreades TaxID=181124 RepID=A0A9P7URS4_9AGAR|nr:uncharacterized protein E1B28_011149 [Marasmius oreades]KAG7089464.1 hypothetical protein E1B28_011149 [Marasmius oreades]
MHDTSEFKFSPLIAGIFEHDSDLQRLLKASTVSILEAYKVPSLPWAAEYEEVSHQTTIHHGLSGFGHRNSLLVIYVAAVMLANRKRFQRQGLHLHFSIYEMQSQDEGGSGNSFQTNCDGALNTGLPGQVKLPTVTLNEMLCDPDIPDVTRLTNLTNLAQCVTDGLDVSQHKEDLKEQNPAALAMFIEAIRKAEVDTSLAFTTRGTVGKIHHLKIQDALDYIQENMKDMITIEYFFNYEVVGLVSTNPQKPQLEVRRVGSSKSRLVEFDFVHLSNGTPWKSPVPDKLPGLPVYSGIPNHYDIRHFLENCQLLENGKIRPGARIGITGMSLSAYDFVPLILNCTSIIEPSETEGYRINEEEAAKYAGLLTFVSNSGDPAPPRHTHPKHFAVVRPILTTEEVHTMLLQKGFEWLSFWKLFFHANVARSLGKLPRDLQSQHDMAPKDRMIDYARQTEAHFNGQVTEVGLLRTGYWLIYGGQGFEVDPDKAEDALVKKAPLSRRERSGNLLRRAALSEVTKLDYVKAGHSNKEFFDEYHTMHFTISGSPARIHHLISRMFELGVATHVSGKFEDIARGESIASGHQVDALFAPKSLDRKCDKVFRSLEGQVKVVVDGQPEYGKGRFLKALDGSFVHAMDMGMGGHGTRVKLPGSSGTDESIVGMRWLDTATLEAAAKSAATVAPMTVLLSSIAAQQGIGKDPVDRLLQYYRKCLPSDEDFAKETAQFKPVWREINEKHAFLQLCQEVTCNGDEYLDYSEKVFDRESREKVVSDLAKRHVTAVKNYHDAIVCIQDFDPPSVEEFYIERFVDFSPSEVESCWEKHCLLMD